MTASIETEERPIVHAPERPTTAKTTRGSRLAAGGLALAVSLVVLATMMRSNADFATNYVAEQLGQQRISFKTAETLTVEEREQPCLVSYAGQRLTTGKQAECYAKSFIGRHLPLVAEGKTFSEMRTVQDTLRAQIADAQAKGDPSAGDLQRQLGAVTGQRSALFEGETMKGLLLTTFGFSSLGTKAAQASTAAYAGGAAILLLSLVALTRARRSAV